MNNKFKILLDIIHENFLYDAYCCDHVHCYQRFNQVIVMQ